MPDSPLTGPKITRFGRLSPVHDNPYLSQDGDSETQWPLHKDTPRTGNRLWKELGRLREENVCLDNYTPLLSADSLKNALQKHLKKAEALTESSEKDSLRIRLLEANV
jgi:hypothetical protein